MIELEKWKSIIKMEEEERNRNVVMIQCKVKKEKKRVELEGGKVGWRSVGGGGDGEMGR